MTVPHRHPRWRAAGRLLILILGIGLTTWGIWLLAFPDATSYSRLGLPIAAWGVLCGYWSMRVPNAGRRHPEDHADLGHDSQSAQPAREDTYIARSAQDEPAGAELVRERDEAARREFELSLEVMLRRELEQGLRQELSGLRRDVAELRGDVLEAVDGRLQMERVEITRIVGSNLATLQDDPHRVALGPGARADVTVPASPPAQSSTAQSTAQSATATATDNRPPRVEPMPMPMPMPMPGPGPSAVRADTPIFAALREAGLASFSSAPSPSGSGGSTAVDAPVTEVMPRVVAEFLDSTARERAATRPVFSEPAPPPVDVPPVDVPPVDVPPVDVPPVDALPVDAPPVDAPPVDAYGVAVHDVVVTPPEPVEPSRPTPPPSLGATTDATDSEPVPNDASPGAEPDDEAVAEAVRAEPVRTEDVAPEPAPPPPAPGAALGSDPFAGLPRLSSFRLPDLPESAPARPSAPSAPASSPGASSPGAAPSATADDTRYVGRRRHADDNADTAGSLPGRHGAAGDSARDSLSPFDLNVGRRSTTNHRG